MRDRLAAAAVLGGFRQRAWSLLTLSAAHFPEAALWGRGPDLRAVRAAVAELAAEPVAGDHSVRVIAVADPASALVDTFPLKVGFDFPDFTVAARVPAFPGMRGRPMYVAAADAVLGNLGIDDPRLRPLTAIPSGVPVAPTTLWSSGGPAAIQAVTEPKGVRPERVDTAATLRADRAPGRRARPAGPRRPARGGRRRLPRRRGHPRPAGHRRRRHRRPAQLGPRRLSPAG